MTVGEWPAAFLSLWEGGPVVPAPGTYPRLQGQEQQQEPARERWKQLLDGAKRQIYLQERSGGASDGAEAAVHFHMPPPRTGTHRLPADTWSHPRK